MVYNNFLGMDVDNIYKEPTNEQFLSAFFNRLYVRLHVYNFSLLVVWYGRHRSGKSLSALLFSSIIDPSFERNLEERIVYSTDELKREARRIRDKKLKGASIVYDEAGSGDLSNQRWYEEKAKRINAVLQSIGYLNPFINFVTQDFFFINSQARKLSQGVFECKRGNNRFTSIKPFWITNDPWTSHIYHKYPIFCETLNDDTISNIYKLGKIRLGLMLPPKTEYRYDKLSKAFKDKLLDAVDEEEEQTHVDTITEIINSIVSNPDPVVGRMVKGIPMISAPLIVSEYNVSQYAARAIRAKAQKLLSKKGI